MTVLRFTGDISSASKDAVLGTYEALDKTLHNQILLNFKGVEYLNSSGIALVIQFAHGGEQRRAEGGDLRSDAALHQGLYDGGHYQVRGAVPDETAALAAM